MNSTTRPFTRLQTSAQFTGDITICVTYDPADYLYPNAVNIFVPGGNPWNDVTTTNDGTGQVCGVTSSLNSFFIAEPATYGSIQATVRIADSLTPLADMWVQLIDPGDSGSTDGYCFGNDETVIAGTQTDSNGSIDFGQVVVGTYCVRLESTNLPLHDPPSVTSQAVTVTEGQVAQAIFEFAFIPTGSIQAQFVDGSGVQFAPETTLCIALRSPLRIYDICDYDLDGYEELSEVRAGHYDVEYPSHSAGYTPLSGFPMTFDVVADQTAQLTLPFAPSQSPTTTFVIDVVDQNGQPVVGACTQLHANQDGSGECLGIESGGRTIIPNAWSPGQINFDLFANTSANRPIATFSIVFDGTQPVVRQTITLQPSLVFTVSQPPDQPWRNVCFSLRSPAIDPYGLDDCLSRNPGGNSLTFWNLPPGDYTVNSTANAGLGQSAQYLTTVTVTGDGAVDVPIVVNPVTRSLVIETVDDLGLPITGGDICYQVLETGVYSCDNWDYAQDGRVEFDGLTGNVTLLQTSVSWGYEPATEPISIDLPATSSIQVVSPRTLQELVVEIVDSAGNRVPYQACFDVRSVETGDNYSLCTRTRDDGPVAMGTGTLFNWLPAGDYELIPFAQVQYAPIAQRTVTIVAGQSHLETIELSTDGVLYELTVENLDESGNPAPGACYAMAAIGNPDPFEICDSDDGVLDGYIHLSSTRSRVPDGAYTVFETRIPTGMQRTEEFGVLLSAGQSITYTAGHQAIEPDHNTGTGPIVSVPLPEGTLTFDNVTQSGITTISASTEPPALPSGFSLDDTVFYEIQTTAVFDGAVTICLTYPEGTFADPSMVRLLHFESGAWIDVTSNGPGSNPVCGQVTSFSPFAIVQQLPPDCHTDRDANVDPNPDPVENTEANADAQADPNTETNPNPEANTDAQTDANGQADQDTEAIAATPSHSSAASALRAARTLQTPRERHTGALEAFAIRCGVRIHLAKRPQVTFPGRSGSTCRTAFRIPTDRRQPIGRPLELSARRPVDLRPPRTIRSQRARFVSSPS